MAMTPEERLRREAAQQARIDEWIRRQLADAPPLSPRVVGDLCALLAGTELARVLARRHPPTGR